MRTAATIGRLAAIGTLLLASTVCLPAASQAKSHLASHHSVTASSRAREGGGRSDAGGARAGRHAGTTVASRHGQSGRTLVHLASLHRNAKYAFAKGSKGRYAGRSSYAGLQCVPFARAASGIELKGNAANWWDAASGVYQRGAEPEAGSVLNFRANGHMRLGHVAVVTAVISAREIAIEHANWAGPGANKGGVARNIPVEDVSANNDWTEVRVGLGRSGDFGSVYPTYGFIYDRPDTGVMVANRTGSVAGDDALAARASYTEVAQAPARPSRAAVRRLILYPAGRTAQ